MKALGPWENRIKYLKSIEDMRGLKGPRQKQMQLRTARTGVVSWSYYEQPK